MGYACPVCDDPQADARHLANHLAFSAILGHEDHEAWLDDHAPGWADEGEAELADRVAEHADQRDYPQVFEDTVNRSGEASLFDAEGHAGHDHLAGGAHPGGAGNSIPPQADITPDEDTEAVLAEARELTREMLADEDDDQSDD
ncbi:DUF5810 domain-containing protein [Halosegnis sp.]|uniref:DUF5810 domain-containing protein n=1 Tax=Halosegnis sp. TaxID=2864959 RepID=UPI0035D44DEC